MCLTEMTQIEPEVRTEVAVRAPALFDLIHHVPRNYVSAREFLLFGLGRDHEAFAVTIQQIAAVSATAFGDKNATGHEAGGMKLDRLHIAQRNDSCFECESGAGSFINGRVSRVLAVDAAVSARRDDR